MNQNIGFRNLNKLHLQPRNVLSCLMEDGGIRAKINGVTHSESYFSGQYSVFHFHIEDKDLGAANYIHMGEPKDWMG